MLQRNRLGLLHGLDHHPPDNVAQLGLDRRPERPEACDRTKQQPEQRAERGLAMMPKQPSHRVADQHDSDDHPTPIAIRR